MNEDDLIDIILNSGTGKTRTVKILDYGTIKEFEIEDFTVDENNILLHIDTRKVKNKEVRK